MSDTNDADALIERLADLAANRRVPRGRDPDALLREAGIVGRARARTAARRRLAVMGGIGGLALAAALAFAVPRSLEGASIETLALGPHTIATTSGTALAIDTLGERTAIRVDGGSALFDVARLPAGAHFEVITPDASVRVVGTVFAVAFVNQHTEVEVFEGVVEVERGGRTTRLVAGERLDGASEAALAALRDLGRDAAARRGPRALGDSRASASESAEPVEDDSPERMAEERTDGRPHDTAHDIAHGIAEPSDDEAGDARERVRLASSPETHIDLVTLRALCDRGEFAAALAALEGVRPPRTERGEWALLEGDAARATGDLARAAGAYERAADALTPSRAALAGFLAASTHERLGELDAALSVLDRARAAERGSPLEERALAMRASLLARTGHARESHEAARRYLASFPGGEASARMEALLE